MSGCDDDEEEIVYLQTKIDKDKKSFAIWPGDEKFEMEKRSGKLGTKQAERKHVSLSDSGKVISTKRKIDETDKDATAPAQPVAKRPSSMINRYFSLENVETVTTNETQTTVNSSTLVQQPIKDTKPDNPERLDFILKKLYKARSLPGEEEKSENKTAQNVDSKVLASASCSSIDENPSTNLDPVSRLYRPDRKHSFGEDFIPLAKSPAPSDSDIEEMNDKLQIAKALATSLSPKAILDRQSYTGPYDLDSINRARSYIIDEFRNSYIDRITEILKMKMNIKSKFDSDQRLWRRIKQTTFHAQRSLSERTAAFERCMSEGGAAQTSHPPVAANAYVFRFNSHTRFMEEDLTEEGKIQCIELNDDDDKDDDVVELDDEEEEDSSENEKDVIRMIGDMRGIEFWTTRGGTEKADSEGSTNNDEADSKCAQFGKYAKSEGTNKQKSHSKQTKQKTVTSSSLRGSSSVQAKLGHGDRGDPNRLSVETKKQTEAKHRSRSSSADSSAEEEDDLVVLQAKYKQIRDDRNKVSKKKKSKLEASVEREVLSEELRQLRKSMKLLRRKKKHGSPLQQQPLLQQRFSSSGSFKPTSPTLPAAANKVRNRLQRKLEDSDDSDLFFVSKKPMKKKQMRRTMYSNNQGFGGGGQKGFNKKKKTKNQNQPSPSTSDIKNSNSNRKMKRKFAARHVKVKTNRQN